MTALLATDALTRRFGGLVAIDAVTTRVESGTVHGLIGPNGAGKTTFLNLISGFTAPSSGTITFDGADVTGRRPDALAKLGIRRTFQNLKLFGELSVLQNVMIGAHTRGKSGVVDAMLGLARHRREQRDLEARARAALDFVGLADHADRQAGSLAYGHRRLLEIARAIVSEPRLLLLDEPAAGLNPTEADRLADLVLRINSGGITIVIVEHHMDVIMSVCSQITVLNYGQVLAEGNPDAIQNNDTVVEAYLGQAGLEERLAAYA